MSGNQRRALKTRNRLWVTRAAAYVSQKNVTPNQISIASILFALLAGGCLFQFSLSHAVWLLVLASVCIQLRLLCNLFDGLVAIEGGKSSPSGELFNDVPDRIADVVILISLGYAANQLDWAVLLGWVAAILSVMTAYVRTLGTSLAAPTSFMGPMAKQHRMALVTIACLLAAFEVWVFDSFYSIYVALWLLVVGTAVTVYRRLHAIYIHLEHHND